MIYVDIFSGFLGAGKTMLIKKLLEEGFYDEKVAIIENEFGEVSIDGAILRNKNTLVREINAGCICCQVTGDFEKSILEVIENYDVERIIIEPTGIAKLSEVKKVLCGEKLRNKVKIDNLISVVDGINFNLYLKNFKAFFVDQIKAANVIVISRSQNLSYSEIKSIEEKIRNINKNASIVTKSWYEEDAKTLLSCIKENKKGNEATVLTLNKKGGKLNRIPTDNVNFDTFALRINRRISEMELISKFKFICSNSGYGDLVRAKGVVQLMDGKTKQFNYTLSELTLDDTNNEGEGVISFIGVNLNKDEISKFFL